MPTELENQLTHALRRHAERPTFPTPEFSALPAVSDADDTGAAVVTTLHAERRRPARMRWAGIAAATVLLGVIAIGLVVTTRGRSSLELGSSNTEVGGQDAAGDRRWLAVPLPGRFTFSYGQVDAAERSAVQFVSADRDQRRIVTVEFSTDPIDRRFTDAITVAGRDAVVATVAAPDGPVDVTIQWSQSTVGHVHAIGIPEADVLAMAESLQSDGSTAPASIEMRLPDGMAPFVRADGSDVEQVAVYRPNVDGVVAYVSIRRDRAKAIAALQALAGPLESRSVDGQKVLVGHQRSSFSNPFWTTTVLTERPGAVITVVGGDDGTLTSDLIELGIRTGPVPSTTWEQTKAAAVALPETNPCATEPSPVPSVKISLADGREVTFSAGQRGAVCLSTADGGDVIVASGVGMPVEQDEAAGSMLRGVVTGDVATVQIETQDHTTTEVATYALPGTTLRAWAMSVPKDQSFRAVEYLSGTGDLIARLGRP